ncbi:hypothetical protein [Halocatena marina]|uniref:hypothetical protein n=1 Tax=Halocatena marina TaxID=2934937 RepID=UPI002010683B|nr:hypothetical protein [Halocatena marina]
MRRSIQLTLTAFMIIGMVAGACGPAAAMSYDKKHDRKKTVKKVDITKKANLNSDDNSDTTTNNPVIVVGNENNNANNNNLENTNTNANQNEANANANASSSGIGIGVELL